MTTFLDMNYVVGQEIRLLIPPTFGCRQLNGLTGIILSILANQVTVSIDSSQNVDEYIASSDLVQSAQIVAIGDVNNGQISSTGEVILPNGGNTNTQVPGAFINISPEA